MYKLLCIAIDNLRNSVRSLSGRMLSRKKQQ